MCGLHNVRASAEDNTGPNTDKGDAPNPRTEIKIPDTAGNRTLAAGLDGKGLYRPRHGNGCASKQEIKVLQTWENWQREQCIPSNVE